ncbi:MAG: signal recognition particle protein [Chloroflexota bacterium]|nr:signal recognition particle protein [Chloroflexota bacterium]
MFESLSEKLQSVFDRLGRKGRQSEEDVELALREVRVALLEADVSLKVVRQFVAAVKEKAVGQDVLHSLSPAQTVIKIVHDQLVELLGTAPPRLTVSPRSPTVVMLIGLNGAGKTTTAAKLALQLRKAGHKALLVAADPYRPAAVIQLQTLGKQIDVPVFHEANKKPPELAQAAVKHAEQTGLSYVILDTAGRLQINEDLMRELETIKSRVNPHETLLVADAMTGQEAVRVAEGFLEHVPLTGVILTKMDGDARGGAALSLREVTGVPIKYVTTGEKLDALEQFHPDRVAQRILGMGDVMSLIERAQEHVDQEQAAKMQSKVVKGEFDLQDFLDQMSQLRKMAGGGGLTGLVEMLPGVGKALKEARSAGQPVDEKQFKRIEAIIQSMTAEERRRPEMLGGSRKRRIAGGSGTSAAEINQLLTQFRQMQAMMKQLSGGMPGVRGLGGLGGLGGGLGALGGGLGAGLPGAAGRGANGMQGEVPPLTAGSPGGSNRQHHKARKKKRRR